MSKLQVKQIVKINKGGKYFNKFFYISNVGQLGFIHCIQLTKEFKVDKRKPLKFYDKIAIRPNNDGRKKPFYANVTLEKNEFYRNINEPAFEVLEESYELKEIYSFIDN
jgi:hypothetical protein